MESAFKFCIFDDIGEQHGKGRVMLEKDLIPGEDERGMVDRIAALVAQKLSQSSENSQPDYEERKSKDYTKKNSPILSDSKEAALIIKSAEFRERERLKRQIVRIAQRLEFTVEFAVSLAGKAIVDIALKRENATVACFMFNCGRLSCEPSTINLCVHSGFNRMLICTPGKVSTDEIYSYLPVNTINISIVSLDGLPDYLNNIGFENLRTENVFKGRKVIVEYTRISNEDAQVKSNAIIRILSKAQLK
ncbi:hypothetical protein [Chitinophaga silvisoli]|uniref:Uncharacterized protein n=1 Tax=Chitinophaga silvisoli TaxID=2291814 RepID=A0A3E1P2L4_9BACT|nr:hypothetical protein [Chitinophaga silvisoli]RFM34407.1 hypothetical protein DXN04_14085 [Chitinophaga silvisoli]